MNKQATNQSRNYSLKLYQAIWLGIFTCFLMLFASVVSANQVNTKPVLQDTAAIKSKINEFLQIQTIGAPGKVSISVGQIDQHIRLQPCAAMETFLPAGSRAWGRTTVGVKCTMPSPWTIYVQARVSVTGEYLAAASPLRQGHVVSEQDLMFLTGDLTTLPPSIFTEKNIAIGQTLSSSITAGTVLRQDMLRKPAAVKQGQTVRIVTTGRGFSVSAEGKALTNASEGQVVSAKTNNGSVISGIARNSGEVIVSF
jgi:flagella basal body P-ring formation protein FlgA